MARITNYIDGAWREPDSGEFMDIVDPARGAVYGQVAASSASDVDAAVQAARTAFPGWATTPAAQRARWLNRLAELIEERSETFALAECTDTGKPVDLARNLDIPRSVSNLRFFAGAIEHFSSELHSMGPAGLNYTLRQPRGVAGLISPWNLPLYLLTWKVAPALASGCSVVAKPSELTPMTANLLAEVSEQAGLPRGVLNVVHGGGAQAGAALVQHRDVPTISFTGGTATGQAISQTTAVQFKKVALEMGGKNPTLIFADADLERAVPQSVRAAFSNQGQICLCGSRIFVEASVYESFLQRFVDATKALKLGDPLVSGTDQGAIVSAAHQRKILDYIELAKREGGSILCGGAVPQQLPERCADGYFIEPTVISGLSSDCRVNQEEIFGPVVTVMPFDDEAQAVARANATPYGLAASIWTASLDRAHRVAAAVDCGVIWINCWLVRDLRVPFGGMKNSGVGREGGFEALRFFMEPKNVCVQL